MPTFDCSFEEFKQSAKEFHEAVSSLDNDELENGFKALSLMYLGMREDMWVNSAAIVLKMATNEYLKRQQELATSQIE